MSCRSSTASVPRGTTSGKQVRWARGLGRETAEGIGTRKPPPQADVCRSLARECGAERCHRKNALTPAERREVVTHLVTVHGLPVQRACRAVGLAPATHYRPLMNWLGGMPQSSRPSRPWWRSKVAGASGGVVIGSGEMVIRGIRSGCGRCTVRSA